MAKWFQLFFLLAARLIKQPEGKDRPKRPSGLPKMPANSPENIRESTLDFTARFGEINPDMNYLCRRGLSGPERAVFAPFPLCSKGVDEKNR